MGAAYTLSASPGPEIRFTVDAPLDSIMGTSTRLSGMVTFDPESLALSDGRITVDPASFATGIDLRDEDLRDQFFEVSKFPEMALQLQKLSRATAAALGAGQEVQAEASGMLTLHGISHPLSFPVTLDRSPDGTTVAVRGSFDILLSDYGIQRPRQLFLKLGDKAQVEVQATFVTHSAPASSPSGTAAASSPDGGSPAPTAVAAVPKVAAKPLVVARALNHKSLPKNLQSQIKKASSPRFTFPVDTAAGRGERMILDPTIGGPGNAISCGHCHSTRDERLGLANDGTIPPDRSLFDVAHRDALWQGFAPGPGKAASICAKMFMLRPEGLSDSQQSDLESYLARISPDEVMPALDYGVLAETRKTDLARPTEGNAKNGQKLTQLYCEACHSVGQIRPPLTPGLYEPDYLVTRVRHRFGNDDRQMPPLYLDRLTNNELRDIVTYLAGNPTERIFKRSRSKP
jgi:polyisoprenoid-binding protein YceI/mono/diheme cytochrome c family protein